MNQFPFGFQLPDGGGEGDPQALGAALQHLGRMLSFSGGPVNWELGRDTARQAAATAGDTPDRSVSDADRRAVADAVRLAELWLDPVTTLPAGASGTLAWSRAEWVEQTLPGWKRLVEPVAFKAVDAMGTSLSAGLAEIPSMTGQLSGMIRQLGGALFGAQIGHGLGALSAEVTGSTDVGLPLGPVGKAALVPAGVAHFGDGLGVPDDQVLLYLALREAAHLRLYAHAPWLFGHVMGAIEGYASGITINTDQLMESISGLDPTEPEALSQALSGELFTPEDSPEQRGALRRLEATLALIEGWVQTVVDHAATDHLPAAAALRETMHRRRAVGGPAEQTFTSLVGLELRPRRLREAATLWTALTDQRDTSGRDELWSHPDLLPTVDDLDDPEGFAARTGRLDLSELDTTEVPPEAEPDSDPGPDGDQ
jgi:putative hydrolase